MGERDRDPVAAGAVPGGVAPALAIPACAVSVRGLTYSYEGAHKILRNVSFDIPEGETVILAGLSGCGKTTLCLCLSGIAPKALGGTVAGTIHVMGEDISRLPLAQISSRIGFVFQDPDNQMVATTVEDEIAFGPENLAVQPAEIRRRVDDELARFGLAPLRLRAPNSLSGGEKRLVAIAAVLALDPPVVILDEPLSHLDGHGREAVLNAVLELQREGRTIIVVEHDLALTGFADRYLHLEDGRVVSDSAGPPPGLLDPEEAAPECLEQAAQ